MSQPTTKKTTLKPHGLRVLDGTKKMLELSVKTKPSLRRRSGPVHSVLLRRWCRRRIQQVAQSNE